MAADNVFPKITGDIPYPSDVNGFYPTGTVIAWAKSLTGVPTLSSHWQECNGQTLSDPLSPYNGQALPNLNGSGGGTQRFLRGSTTSGSTGGSETHTHNITVSVITPPGTVGTDNVGNSGVVTSAETSTLPSYYEIVWIMRVR